MSRDYYPALREGDGVNLCYLPAGPELDRLIHTKVMGKDLTVHAPVRAVSRSLPLEIHPGAVYCMQDVPALVEEPPPYSIDIARAWEVIERMRALGWILSMWNTHDGGWYCEMETMIGAREYAESPTAPLAICRAAIIAVSA